MQGISDYLKVHHPRYRQATMRKLYGKIRALREAPHIGRPGRIEGTREIFFSPMPYVAVYRMHEDAIEVWRIWHTSQSRNDESPGRSTTPAS